MNPAHEPLFTPFTIRKTEIKNRYYMAPMGTTTHNDEDGAYLPDAVDHYVKRAAGGVGLIITGANWVDNNIEVHSPGSFPCPTICPGKYIKSARELTDRVHAFGTKIFVQLTAGLGRSAMPAMIRLRCRKLYLVGATPGGYSLTTLPPQSMISRISGSFSMG